MIHIDRSRTPLPSAIAQSLRREQQELVRFQKQVSGGSKRYQQRTFRYPAIRFTAPVLKELFANKCAYCETPLAGLHGDPENFRPRAAVEEPDGTVLRQGYWWLAHEWANLYLSCTNCNRLHKRNKFPIDGERAKPGTRGKALSAEKPLLVDPCLDEPAEFFWFDQLGELHARDPEIRPGHARRAKTTIEILGLNRPDLVEARGLLFRWVKSLIPQLLKEPTRDVVRQVLAPDAAYSGAASQWLVELLAPSIKGSTAEIRSQLVALGISPAIAKFTPSKAKARPGRTPRSKRSAPGALGAPVGLDRVSSAKEALPEAIVARPVFIKQISLRNFKALRRLDLELPTAVVDDFVGRPGVTDAGGASPDDHAAASRTGWFVFLGENAVGKSSILEGIALAAMGEKHFRELVDSKTISLSKLVHVSPNEKPGAKSRTCVIKLTLAPLELGEIELRITRTSFKFIKGGKPLPTLIRGYGFVRLLPQAGEDPDRTDSLARCENLFHPRTPLCDAERWMASLPYKKKETSSFDIAARTILDLLPSTTLMPDADADDADADTHLTPVKGRVVMTLKQRKLSLDQLSSGYQSVIALAADIMSGIPPDRLFDMREACGIVLIDEIGTQLHPRWRMHAIDDLRRAFPGMQFIATTHEPLCLKGVGLEEVAVLRRDGPQDDVTAITKGLQNPRLLRVDQLLTSPFFGLDSTIDPSVDQMFQRYFGLLRKKPSETTAEGKEREQLKLQLAPHRGLGYTRSDQAVYALLEEFLATEGAQTRKRAEVVSEPVRRQIFDIWRNVAARHRGQA